MSKVTILTGDVRSGKTTALFRMATSEKNIDGVLQPIVDGERCLYLIGERKLLHLETPFESEDAVRIGSYFFSATVFGQGGEYLRSLLNSQTDTILIDEIGFLELRGEGMEPAFSGFLTEWVKVQAANLIIVVRTKLLPAFTEQYSHFFPEGWILAEHTQ